MLPPIPFDPDEFVQEGAVPASGVVLLASTLGQGERARNVVRLGTSAGWLAFRTSGEAVLSVDAAPDGRAYVLGENGTVVGFDWRSRDLEGLRASRRLMLNPSAMGTGPMRRARVLNGTLVCCGALGQVYALDGADFVALPRLGDHLVEDVAQHRGEVVAATATGRVAALRSGEWVDLECPAGRLAALCEHDDGLAAVGEGIHLWDGVNWTSPVPTSPMLWGVASHEGDLYVTHEAGVDRLVGAERIPLDTTGETYAVLRCGPDGVWCFAGQTVHPVRSEEVDLS